MTSLDTAKITSEILGMFPNRLVSAAIYGSHVAGYAKPGSDCDVLVIADDYRQGVKYVYFDLDGLKVSALIADRKKFEEDVRRASLGEFVAGRMCSVMEPIFGENYLRKQEITYKARVIVEELSELAGEFGPLLAEMLIPLRYFLFSRLKKRLSYYPPVAYSYVKTFFASGRANENLRRALHGFKGAARRLEDEGLVSLVDDDRLAIRNYEAIKPRRPLQGGIRLAIMALRSYITHAKAGRIGVKNVMYEFASKGKRALEKLPLPDELKVPKSILALRDGPIFRYDTKDIKQILDKLSSQPVVRYTTRRIGGFMSTAFEVHASCQDGRDFRLIYKRYSDFNAIKWIFVAAYSLPNIRFKLLPKSRMLSEVLGSLRLREMGLKVPEVKAVLWKTRAVLMEYIDGTSLDELIRARKLEGAEMIVEKLGNLLSSLHSSGLCIIDTKPQNFLVTQNNDVVITDLEQMRECEKGSWDLALLIFYSFRLSPDSRIARKFVRALMKGYVRTQGDLLTVKDAMSLRYVRIFLPIVPLNVLLAIRKSVATRTSQLYPSRSGS